MLEWTNYGKNTETIQELFINYELNYLKPLSSPPSWLTLLAIDDKTG
jgi:hypothetical protein